MNQPESDPNSTPISSTSTPSVSPSNDPKVDTQIDSKLQSEMDAKQVMGEQEQQAKRIKTLESSVQYLLQQLEEKVGYEEIKGFQEAVVAKHDEIEGEIAIVKKLVAATSKARTSPMDQWTQIVAEMETTTKKRRK